MEGVGARLGRSSSRYAPAPAVFNGPVRKWKKKWVHVVSSSAGNNGSSYNPNPQTANHNGTIVNGNNGSHLLLYKWTPVTQPQNNDNSKNSIADHSSTKDAAAATGSASADEEPPRRKFKYIPIVVLEEQKIEALENEAAEKVVNEAKPNDTDSNTAQPTSKSDGLGEKPDINDLPMEENQALNDNPLARQDLNESTLDLSLA
ncbi:uncharacterized protein LOC127808251 [Diospyros lotus]|uniref:uncharacterized protein LOC127808251 n=1 Tax=Diospyros lotus TaxID=55363 RepID=UPI002255209D|nr:uncharacterized protein LOC127808251 [Diospyros lotus]